MKPSLIEESAVLTAVPINIMTISPVVCVKFTVIVVEALVPAVSVLSTTVAAMSDCLLSQETGEKI